MLFKGEIYCKLSNSSTLVYIRLHSSSDLSTLVYIRLHSSSDSSTFACDSSTFISTRLHSSSDSPVFLEHIVSFLTQLDSLPK